MARALIEGFSCVPLIQDVPDRPRRGLPLTGSSNHGGRVRRVVTGADLEARSSSGFVIRATSRFSSRADDNEC